MSIFKRSKDSARPAAADPDVEPAPDDLDDDVTGAEEAPAPVVDRTGGPFDVTEVEGRDGRVDLGAAAGEVDHVHAVVYGRFEGKHDLRREGVEPAGRHWHVEDVLKLLILSLART